MLESYSEKLLKFTLFTIFAFLPIFFIPLAVNVELGRDIVFGVLLFIAFSLWLVEGIKKGKVFFIKSLSFFSAIYLVFIVLLSSYFAKGSYFSFFHSSVSGEKGVTLIIGFILLLLLPSLVSQDKKFPLKALHTIFVSGAIAAFFVLLQFLFGFSVFGSIFAFARSVDFNAVGTINGFSMLLVGLLTSSLSLVIFDNEPVNHIRRILFRTEILIFLLALCVIRSSLALYMSLFVLVLVSVLHFIKSNKLHSFDFDIKNNQKALVVIAGASITLLFCIFGILPQSKQIVPVEISPSHKLTWHIGVSTVKSGYKNALVGVGPASFGESWGLYKDKDINTTNFWNVKFNQGSSLLVSSLTTLGILGFIAMFMLLVVSPVLLLLRLIVMSRRKTLEAIHVAYFAVYVSLALALTLYSTTLLSVYLFFASLGIFLSLLTTEKTQKNNFVEEILAIEAVEKKPHTYISGSLLSIGLILGLSLSVYGIFFEITKARSLFLQAFGYIALSNNDIPSAVTYMERAVDVDQHNPQNQEALFDAYNAQNLTYLKEASKGVDVKNDVDDFIPKIVGVSKSMIALNPGDPNLWTKQAHLYESLILLSPNAEKYAIVSIKKAFDLDPMNPQRAIDVARIYMTIYDRMMIVQKNSKGSPSKALVDLTNDSLLGAVTFSDKSISLMPNFVLAHIVRAHIALREKNNNLAVGEVEKVKSIAKGDASVAFESGIIRYKVGDLLASESEFTRALDIDTKYSDARYYLAFVQYELGKFTEAVASMEQVFKANPDNKDIEATLLKFKNGEYVSPSSNSDSNTPTAE